MWAHLEGLEPSTLPIYGRNALPTELEVRTASRAGDESNVAWPRYTKMQHGAQPMGHRAEWGDFDLNEGPRRLEIRVLCL